jgi:hypothetical protein
MLGVPILQAPTDDAARILEFYKTVSGLAFALLGLWWVALELRFKDWEESPRARRHAYGVMLFFLFPGLMSLFSLIDGSGTWWRLVFAITALLGVAEIALYYSAPHDRRPAADLIRAVGLVTYVLVLIVALRPLIARDLGIDLSGLQVEAVLTGILIVVGVHLAFLAMTEHQSVAPT